MAAELQLKLPVRATAPAAARHALAALEGDLDPSTYDDIKLALSELVTNSILHAGLRSDDHVVVTVVAHTTAIRVEVADTGNGFARPDPPQPKAASGFGLAIVDRLATRWGVTSDDRTRVWLEVANGG